MDDVIDYQRLVQLLEGVLERTASAVAARGIAGLALCTDDELSGVFVAFCTVAATQHSPDLRFRPEEWDGRIDDPGEREASALLAKRAGLDVDGDRHSQIDRAYDSLVIAVDSVRKHGRFAPEVFLTVLSTDPCDAMVQAERATIQKLNSPATVAEWRRFHLGDARQVLARYEAMTSKKSWEMIDLEVKLRAEIAEHEAALGARAVP